MLWHRNDRESLSYFDFLRALLGLVLALSKFWCAVWMMDFLFKGTQMLVLKGECEEILCDTQYH